MPVAGLPSSWSPTWSRGPAPSRFRWTALQSACRRIRGTRRRTCTSSASNRRRRRSRGCTGCACRLRYARANRINRLIDAAPQANIGIVTAGKSYADTQQALAQLGVAGGQVRLLKIGMVWPLDPDIVAAFAQGLDSIVVIEEKRPLLEDQIKTILYDAAMPGARPKIVGKFASASVWSQTSVDPMFSMVGELNPSVIAERLAALLGIQVSAAAAVPAIGAALAERMPTFCSGCPHSTSTRVPEGSMALAGIAHGRGRRDVGGTGALYR